MFLFELAMELGVRSADMADAAPELGLQGISPTSELTPEQADVLRAKFTKGRPPGAPASGLAPASPPLAVPPPPGSAGGSGRGGSRVGAAVGIAVAAIAAIALFGFMAVNSGPDKEREAQLARDAAVQDAQDAKAYEAGGAAGTDPIASADPTGPTDVGRFCRAGLALHANSTDLSEKIEADDYDGAKSTMIAGLERWKANVAEMRATLPPSFAEKGRIYEEFYGNFYLTWIDSTSVDDLNPKLQAMDTTVSSAAWHDLQTLIFDNCE